MRIFTIKCCNLALVTFLVQRSFAWSPTVSRRYFTDSLCLSAIGTWAPLESAARTTAEDLPQIEHPFVYSEEWTGTKLSLLSLEVASDASKNEEWSFARWPDPILRRKASPVPREWFNSEALERAGERLRNVARREKAVGLAAQQCGVDARLVFIDLPQTRQGLIMVNPRIVHRSPEVDMLCWKEQCLVLPPSFSATLLRDAQIEVDYYSVDGAPQSRRFSGELARCVQHELDHDRGILTLDHVGLDEMEGSLMRRIETHGHADRQSMAFSRYVEDKESFIG